MFGRKYDLQKCNCIRHTNDLSPTEDILSVEDTNEEMKRRYLKNIEAAQIKGEVRSDLSAEMIWLVTEKLNELVRDGSWKTIFNDYSEFQKQLRKMYFYGLLEYAQKSNKI